MRKVFLLILLITFKLSTSANIKDDLGRIYDLLLSDREAAKELILKLKSTNDDLRDDLWMVRSNFYLAYIHKLDDEYGKSVIYYLEAIRNAENASYEGIIPEKISLHKNLSNIFHQFNAHDLGESYSDKALEFAQLSTDTSQIISIKLNKAINLRKRERFDSAIDLFLEVYSMSPSERVVNEIGLAFMLKKDWINAKLYFNKLLEEKNTSKIYTARAFHNLGEIEYENGNIEDAIGKLIVSIEIKESLSKKDFKSLFTSYMVTSEYLLEMNALDDARAFLEKAEKLTSKINLSLEQFHIYELLSEYNSLIGETGESQYYSNLYSSKLKSHIDTQEEIQETDKRYNMDLITKRYFDEVAKQEKIASILFYSRLTSGGLLALLLLVIGYNRYEKMRIRRSIEQKLVQFEMLD